MRKNLGAKPYLTEKWTLANSLQSLMTRFTRNIMLWEKKSAMLFRTGLL